MSKPTASRKSVAIVGSGMAGLVCAYLLKNDPRQRFDVQILEMQDQLSLDSASHSLTQNYDEGKSNDRVDMPLRAFSAGYYDNLRRMYEYFNLKFITPRFVYTLSTLPDKDNAQISPYFIHSSNNHRLPPLRPEGCPLHTWLLEVCYLLLCYTWFTLCCFTVQPCSTSSGETESLGEYLQRIRIPWYYTKRYLLPMMSSVTTCTHKDLLAFPAIDIVEYERRTFRQPHYTIAGGVRQIEEKLSRHQNVRFGARVTDIRNSGTQVQVTWADMKKTTQHVELFDYVITAVTPDVVGSIFQPLQDNMAQIPTVKLESLVHFDYASIRRCSDFLKLQQTTKRMDLASTPPAQAYHICSNATRTESVHEHPSSALVTTFPITPIDPEKIAHTVQFTRVLRTPLSRNITNHIFNGSPSRSDEKGRLWKNGDDNIFLVGGWCWDGMILLEGCVASAMRVAECLEVEVPWRSSR